MVVLTIGMATYNDFDGVYFTLQALRLYQNLDDTELLVVDNYGCEDTRQFVEGWAGARYILATDAVGTAAPRDRVFREAHGEAVLCCDSHILFAPGVVKRLRKYYRKHPETIDLLQGPIVYDDLQTISTHFDPVWRAQMWGIWATDPRGVDPEGKPFEIPMQGLGVFSCRKAAWLGFNPAFRGFGGEEGYIHEKFRQAGGRCLCLPWLRWVHRFSRPGRVPYPLNVEDKLWNYIIGHTELGLNLEPVLEHFAEYLPQESITALVDEAVAERGSEAPKARYAYIADNSESSLPKTTQDETLPLVSCICPTYGRPPSHQYLLEEAIESFLRQTYPNKELIVLNDCGAQELVCDVPGVRVINVRDRFPTLGDKRNAGVLLSAGELIAPWDDDDISLPWRLSLLVDRLGTADYLNPDKCWWMDGSTIRLDPLSGGGLAKAIFRRSAFDIVGGYQSITNGEDAGLERAILALDNHVDPLKVGLSRREWYYIYRWGVSPAHLSSRYDDSAYPEIGTRPVQSGRFVLRPHWRSDYESETQLLVLRDADEITGF